VFLLLFMLSMTGQIFTGRSQYNEEMAENGSSNVSLTNYLTTGHFFESTFENWESEFLQMALFLILSMFLYQKGSAESKDPDKPSDVDREPDINKTDVPKALKARKFSRAVYEHSLCYTLVILFLVSFLLHWYGSLKDYNQHQQLEGKSTATAIEFLANSKFWFESFQNWESEFLSIFAIIVLSIFLREKGSPQSKPVDASNSESE
jgi:hypothetical protein